MAQLVAFDGSRSSSGSIVLLSNPPVATPAIYEIALIPGRTTGIIYNPKSVLTNHDGGRLLLDVGPPDKGDNGSRFTAGSDDNFIIHLNIGGYFTFRAMLHREIIQAVSI